MQLNPNCDGDHCTAPHGEVRVLPLGTSPHHGNLILCQSCFDYEIAYRRDRNRDLSPDCRFDLPDWKTLKIHHWKTYGRNSDRS